MTLRITRQDVLNNFCVGDLDNISAFFRIRQALERADRKEKRMWKVPRGVFSFAGTARSLKHILALRDRIKK
ncbi:MAG: hypothetical protein ACMUJM_08945 [bacterium]